MRKLNVASISLAAIMGGTTLLSAQTTTAAPAPAPAPTPATATSPTPARQLMHARRHHHHRGLFRGVGLSADQRAKLASMRDQYRTEAMPLMSQKRAARADLRAALARHDSAAVTAVKAKLYDTHAQLQHMRERWLSDARGMLTPAQQARFDRNVARHKAARERHHQRRTT